MKVGDLVKGIKWTKGLVGYAPSARFGIILEVPPEDDYWGVTAIVQWMDGEKEELQEEEMEVISESR